MSIENKIHSGFNSATDENELKRVASDLRLKNYHGAFTKDKLPTKLKRGCYLINYCDSNQKGTHWAGLYMKNNKDGFWFSSFGDPPIDCIASNTKLNITYNSEQIQAFRSSLCGLYTLAFFYLIENNIPFKTVCCDIFSHRTESGRFKNNEILLKLLDTEIKINLKK